MRNYWELQYGPVKDANFRSCNFWIKVKRVTNSIIMKYCHAAVMPLPANPVLQIIQTPTIKWKLWLCPLSMNHIAICQHNCNMIFFKTILCSPCLRRLLMGTYIGFYRNKLNVLWFIDLCLFSFTEFVCKPTEASCRENAALLTASALILDVSPITTALNSIVRTRKMI